MIKQRFTSENVHECQKSSLTASIGTVNIAANSSSHTNQYISIVLSDPRAKSFPFMETPLPTIGMIATYLAWVLIIGPIYMRDRKPMDLKNTLIYYNAFQVLLSGYMFYEVVIGWHIQLSSFNHIFLSIRPITFNLNWWSSPSSFQHLMSGWMRGYSLSCQPVDYSDGPLSRRVSWLFWIH